MAPNRNRCNIGGCKVIDPSIERLDCSCGDSSCTRKAHVACYRDNFLKGSKPHFEQLNEGENPGKVACAVKCYKRCLSKFSLDMEQRNVLWYKDGPLGPDDPNNSESILIQWLIEPGNYAKYRAPPNGQTKIGICEAISSKIRAAGILKDRPPASVKGKIENIEGLWRQTHDFAVHTGAGIKVKDGVKAFEDACTNRFKYYFDLEEVFCDRASARAKHTTDGNLLSGSSSSEGEEQHSGDDGEVAVEGENVPGERDNSQVQNSNTNATDVPSEVEVNNSNNEERDSTSSSALQSASVARTPPTAAAITPRRPKKRTIYNEEI